MFLGKVGGSLTVDLHRLRNRPTSNCTGSTAEFVIAPSKTKEILQTHNYVKDLDREMAR